MGWQSGLFYALCFFSNEITLANQVGRIKKECEAPLPRDQFCEIKFHPVTQLTETPPN